MKSLKFILLIAVISFAGYSVWKYFFAPQKNGEAVAAVNPAAQAMPVEMAVITPEQIQVWKNFSGHVVAVEQAEIRPQISGRITDIRFNDGQNVNKGDVLLVIDPRPYEATLGQAKASLISAKTKADLASKEYDRARNLIESEAISKSVLDTRANNRQIADAAIKEAQAMVESAQINLDYAYVKAPITGKVSRAEITVGNLVQSGSSAPLLTSIVADEKVYVDFEVDEKTYLSSASTYLKNKDVKIPVRLKLFDDADEYNGVVESFDNKIDQSSGTIRARAIFNNKDKILLPGMSVGILLGSPSHEDKIMISERAIGTDQDRKFVFVVDNENKATYREVQLGESVEGNRVVLSGLESGEKIITDGLVRVRPGVVVSEKQEETPVENQLDTSSKPENSDTPEKE